MAMMSSGCSTTQTLLWSRFGLAQIGHSSPALILKQRVQKPDQRLGQVARQVVVGAQQEEGEARGALGADARQVAELLDQPRHGLGHELLLCGAGCQDTTPCD
jgi:hypothetical protein